MDSFGNVLFINLFWKPVVLGPIAYKYLSSKAFSISLFLLLSELMVVAVRILDAGTDLDFLFIELVDVSLSKSTLYEQLVSL